MSAVSRHLVAVVLLVAAGAAVYLPSLDGPFIYDDRINIVDNEALSDIGDVRAVLSSGYQETRPLTLLSFALCFELGGSARVFRLFNLALHLLVVLCVYLLGLRLCRDIEETWRGLPAAAALLFAVHPLAVEGVAYINARSGLLATLFSLASIVLLLDFDRAVRGRRLRYLGALLCLLLAVASKESAVVTPILAGLYLWLVRQRSARALLPPVGLLAVVGIAAALALLSIARYPHARTFGLSLMPWGAYLQTQPRVIVHALTLPFFPLEQSFDYDFRLARGIVDPEFLVAIVVLGALLALAWRARRVLPVCTLALLWYLIALAPTNSIVQFRDFLAERHLYLSLVAFALLVPWALSRWAYCTPSLQRPLVLCFLAIAATFGALATQRAQLFADPIALWTQTAAASPAKARALTNLGIALAESGRHADARHALRRAIHSDPRSHDAWYNLGVNFEHAGEPERALRCFRKATELAPRPVYHETLSRAADRLGVIRFRSGNIAGATKLFRLAARENLKAAGPRFNLAMAIMRANGPPEQVARLLREVLRLDPAHRKARFWLNKLESL